MTEDEMNELNRQLRGLTNQRNNTPSEDFAGLSPSQVFRLNNHPLEEGCVVRWQEDIPGETLAKVPFLTFAVDLLQRLSEKEIKLTAKGNLPAKLVKEWYATGLVPQWDVEEGISKIGSEDDYYAAKTLKYVLKELGWTKTRSGKLSITSKGKKALTGSRQNLLEKLFEGHFKGFNIGYFDGFEDEGALQQFYGFILVLLLKNGKDWRLVSTYGEELLRAFPTLAADFKPSKYATSEVEVSRAAQLRFFERSLHFYGLLRLRGLRHPLKSTRETMATDLFRSLFQFAPDALRPEQPGDADIQISSALFDAEMGSTSWASNDMPPELQQQFHDQIRAFHANDGEGRVTIGSLLADFDFPDQEKFTDENDAVDAIEKLLLAFQERFVFFDPPHHLAPSRLYRFLVTDFLAHEIPPPSPMLPAFVPLEEIDPELATPPARVLAAETFFMALLTIDQPIPEEIFHKLMRLEDGVVPRALALAKTNAWRSRWSSILPLSFAPGPVQEQDGFVYQFVQVAFKATNHNNQTTEMEWTGVVQLIPIGEELLIYGGSFEGKPEGFTF